MKVRFKSVSERPAARIELADLKQEAEDHSNRHREEIAAEQQRQLDEILSAQRQQEYELEQQQYELDRRARACEPVYQCRPVFCWPTDQDQ